VLRIEGNSWVTLERAMVLCSLRLETKVPGAYGPGASDNPRPLGPALTELFGSAEMKSQQALDWGLILAIRYPIKYS
jgi:hypothetical protein